MTVSGVSSGDMMCMLKGGGRGEREGGVRRTKKKNEPVSG